LRRIAALPDALREPAALFFVHDCSHQDIATFLNLPLATVNNRLHAARSQLKERMLTMVTDTLREHQLPDDFANHVGRLIEARGNVVDLLFDPAAMPDILAELTVSDEANRRGVKIQVAQRPAPGLVRGLAATSADALARGSTVLNSGQHVSQPFARVEFARTVGALAGHHRLRTHLPGDGHQGYRCDLSSVGWWDVGDCRRSGRGHNCRHGVNRAAAVRWPGAVDHVCDDAACLAGMAVHQQARLFVHRGT